MGELMSFSSPEFGTIRTVEVDGEPWFVGKDVAKALGYTANPRKAIRDHVDPEDRGEQNVPPSENQSMVVINESGLYSLVLSSKLPGAKGFKRWVTAEVLPSIRRSGSYLTAAAQETMEKLAATVNTLAERVERLESRPALPAGRLSGGELGYRAWSRQVSDKLALLQMMDGLEGHEILSLAYRCMERELGIDLDAERKDTMARYGLEDCSTLRSIYHRDDLRTWFQEVIDREFRYEEFKGW